MARIEKKTFRKRQKADVVYPETLASQVTCEDGDTVEQKLEALPKAEIIESASKAIEDLDTIRERASNAVQPDDIADDLTTDDATKVLSARQGKVLEGMVSQLGQKVDDLSTGKYYGYFAKEEDLPEADVDGFAYVGEGPTYTIYNLRGGAWTSSDITVNQSPIGNEEDINQSEDGKLQFANRVYNAQQPNGMGYKILRKDATFSEQVTDADTIYEIRYDFDLGGASVTIPAGCVLKFNGGIISNGAIIGTQTGIVAESVKLFESLTISGKFNVAGLLVEWFGAIGDNSTDDTDAIQAGEIASETIGTKLIFLNKNYIVKRTIALGAASFWEGQNLSSGIGSETLTSIKFATTQGIMLQYTGSASQKRAFVGISFTSQNLSNVLFDCGFDGGVVDKCKVFQFGIVFNKFLLHCSIIRDCNFGSIGTAFVVGNVTDSIIDGNYISGYRPNNANCFLGGINNSRIVNNYFDYFKTIKKVTSVSIGGAIFNGNTIDYCWKPFDFEFDVSSVVISGNAFTNISNCIGGSAGFNAPDQEMQALPPAALFFGSVSSSYVEGTLSSRVLSIVFAGNKVDGQVRLIGGVAKELYIHNSYSTLDGHIVGLHNYTNTPVCKNYIDLLEMKEIDSFKGVGYDGAILLQKGHQVLCSVPSLDGVYIGGFIRYLNASGYGALDGNPNPQLEALMNGWIPMDFFSSSYFYGGVITANGNYERSDYIDMSRYANGVKFVNGGSAAVTLVLFDANKVQVSTQIINEGSSVSKTITDGQYAALWANYGILSKFHAEAL